MGVACSVASSGTAGATSGVGAATGPSGSVRWGEDEGEGDEEGDADGEAEGGVTGGADTGMLIIGAITVGSVPAFESLLVPAPVDFASRLGTFECGAVAGMIGTAEAMLVPLWSNAIVG